MKAKNGTVVSSACDSESTLLLSDDTYQDPVVKANGKVSYLLELETNPQGRHLGLFSTIVLFISRMLGSGIFSISSTIYEDCGRSVAIFFLAWFVATLVAFSGLYVYLEMGSIVPRSGGTKVFLEFIYDKPYLLATVAFLIFSLITGFTTTNILVFGEYFLTAIGIEPTLFSVRSTALIFLLFAAGLHGFSLKNGVKVQNFLGAMKILLLLVMVVSGIYVTFFPKEITNIDSNLHWDEVFLVRSKVTASSFAGAVIKAQFALAGWSTVHTVSNEIHNPARTFKIAGPTSLILVSVAYFLTNLSYLIVIPDEEFVGSGILAGSKLFEKLFGFHLGHQLLTFSIALCAAGNVFVVLYTISRNNQEVFREGYLPFSKFMASNWPLGAPFRALLFSVFITLVILVALPDGDIYSYIIAFDGYGNTLATGLVALGIFIIRKRYPDIKPPIRASKIGTLLILLVSLYLLISPLTASGSPNPKDLQDFPSYAIASLVCILICIAYWYAKFSLLPKWFNYRLQASEYQLEDGLVVKEWVRISGV